MVRLTGKMFNVTWGKTIVFDESDLVLRVGDRIWFENQCYEIVGIPTACNTKGKCSVIVKQISEEKRL